LTIKCTPDLLGLGNVDGVLADGGEGLLVDGLNVSSLDAVLDVLCAVVRRERGLNMIGRENCSLNFSSSSSWSSAM
jgi:hypothetical protein